ncbi:siderophore-interacting protein [Xanthomonas translucens]|uniref:siderophore-interacting protein n=1 Tax=Xanthomonas campestris pv. translucens TaxID=343 RepID=UPI0018D45C51|nr:siderophore-interacting protein [Xanthomonas translucens pv. translucens]
MHRAHVTAIEDVGPAFRIITLGGESLRTTTWTPADKIQIQWGNWIKRTYTPVDWDTENGTTRILIYKKAGGPGSQWARTVRTGDECIVFGARNEATRRVVSAAINPSLAPSPPAAHRSRLARETRMLDRSRSELGTPRRIHCASSAPAGVSGTPVPAEGDQPSTASPCVAWSQCSILLLFLSQGNEYAPTAL